MHFLDFFKSKSDNGVFILLTYLKGDEFLMKNQIIYQHGPSVSMADLKGRHFSFVKKYFYLPLRVNENAKIIGLRFLKCLILNLSPLNVLQNELNVRLFLRL